MAWPSMRAAFALPQAALGLMLAGVSAGTFSAGLISGGLIEAIGLHAVLVAAASLAAMGLAIEAAAPDIYVICCGALAVGLGAGTLDAAINAAGVMRFTARQVNWMHGCYGLGAMFGPLCMTAAMVTAGMSWRAGLALLTVLLVGVAALFAHAATRTPSAPRQTLVPGGWAAAARHPLVQLQMVLFFVYTGLEVTLGQWSFSILTEARGVPVGMAGLWAGAFWLSIAGGRFLLGAVVERVGADRLVRLCSITVVLGALIFAGAPGAYGAAGLMLAGLSLAPIFPTLMSRAPERLGAAIAMHAVGFKVSAAMVGAAGLPALAGLMAQSVGLESIGWFAVATALVLLVLHEAVIVVSTRSKRAERAAQAAAHVGRAESRERGSAG